MSYFTQKPLKQINLPTDNNYWVKISTALTYGDVKGFGLDDQSQAADKLLLLAIKEWNLDDEQGNVFEITSENIDLLQKDDALAIIEEISKEVGDPDEKKDSTK